MCETNEELLWQLQKEREHNTALLNELARYRTELGLTRTELDIAHLKLADEVTGRELGWH